MFRRIVSRLSFSPALVGQLSFYAKRLRKEQVTRRLGLVFTALALVVQSLVVFQAPEPANAASANDMVYGGLGLGSNRSLSNFLNPYDRNSANLQDIMNSFGITREEINRAAYGSFKTSSYYSWGRHARTIDAGSMKVTDSNGTHVTTVYGRPMSTLYKSSNKTIYGYIGHSASIGWFAIMQDCGNLVTTHIPPPKVPPAPGKLTFSKSALNVSQGNIDASKQVAHANDRITYTLTAKNTGGSPVSTVFEDNLGDILEYSTLVDNGGGIFNKDTKALTWPEVSIAASKTESRSYAVKLNASIPATPVGKSDQTSYDCVMDNVFGNGVMVPVSCAPPKVVEEIVRELPETGPTENVIFGGIVLAIVSYFYFRSKQMNKEVRLIRRDLNAGTI